VDAVDLQHIKSIIRSVDIFAKTPENAIDALVGLVRVCDISEGEVIFNKGDIGACMYIIVSGQVRVFDGEMVLNDLYSRDVFGEMAMLDAETRSASVRTVNDTTLLMLEQTPFYEFMANHPEVARGIIQVLSQRLRARMQDMMQDFLYIQQMQRLTSAAAALEDGFYEADSIAEVKARADALGQLANVFDRMAKEVIGREARLNKQVMDLRIEINNTKRAREVAEITESDFFKEIERKAKAARSGKKHTKD
jgi:CRP-like cAMP-binding protein